MSRNIVLVTVDSLRADHCGFLGSEYDTTPTLDRLARESLVFENAIAPGPRTPSSIPVCFTGQFYQGRSPSIYETWKEKSDRWQERRERLRQHLSRYGTFVDRLQQEGYSTTAVTANPWTASDTGFDRGFDTFHHVGADKVRPGRGLPTRTLESLVDLVVDGAGDEWLATWPQYYERVTGAIAEQNRPYFLWVFLMDPHQPYIASRQFRSENTGLEMFYSNLRYNFVHSFDEQLPFHLHERLQRAYRDTVRSVDRFIHRLQNDLGGDDPVVVFHADHGEAFYEHGTYGHRLQLYQENIKVPLLVYNIDTTGRITAPVSLARLPQLLARIAQPGTSPDPSRFRVPVVVSKTEEAEREAIIVDQWKYIRDTGAYIADEVVDELYHLQADPDEQRNMLDSDATVRRELSHLLDKHGRAEQARISKHVESLPSEREL